MMWSDVRESDAIVKDGVAEKCSRAVWMAASSALSTVLFSSRPVASMSSSVLEDGCMTAAPKVGLGSILEPSVYTHDWGSQRGVQGGGSSGVVRERGVRVGEAKGRVFKDGGGWVRMGGVQGSKAPGAY